MGRASHVRGWGAAIAVAVALPIVAIMALNSGARTRVVVENKTSQAIFAWILGEEEATPQEIPARGASSCGVALAPTRYRVVFATAPSWDAAVGEVQILPSDRRDDGDFVVPFPPPAGRMESPPKGASRPRGERHARRSQPHGDRSPSHRKMPQRRAPRMASRPSTEPCTASTPPAA